MVVHEEVGGVGEGAVAAAFVEAGDGDPFGDVLAVVPLLVAGQVGGFDVGPEGHEARAGVWGGGGHGVGLGGGWRGGLVEKRESGRQREGVVLVAQMRRKANYRERFLATCVRTCG